MSDMVKIDLFLVFRVTRKRKRKDNIHSPAADFLIPKNLCRFRGDGRENYWEMSQEMNN